MRTGGLIKGKESRRLGGSNMVKVLSGKMLFSEWLERVDREQEYKVRCVCVGMGVMEVGWMDAGRLVMLFSA